MLGMFFETQCSSVYLYVWTFFTPLRCSNKCIVLNCITTDIRKVPFRPEKWVFTWTEFSFSFLICISIMIAQKKRKYQVFKYTKSIDIFQRLCKCSYLTIGLQSGCIILGVCRVAVPSVRGLAVRRPSVVNRLSPILRDAIYPYIVEKYKWNLRQIFSAWVDIKEEVYKVRGQTSRSWKIEYYNCGRLACRRCGVEAYLFDKYFGNLTGKMYELCFF